MSCSRDIIGLLCVAIGRSNVVCYGVLGVLKGGINEWVHAEGAGGE